MERGRGRRNAKIRKSERVRKEISPKSNLKGAGLFNVLIRQENAVFVLPANSSVIREEEGWRERERERERGGGRWSRGVKWRIKHTELMPCVKKKSDRSKK